MDFFDRLGTFARSVSDKTGDMLEISKINAQIRSKEDDIEELKLKLGEYIWTKYDSGVIMDNQASSICRAIRSAYDEINACKDEISDIRRAQEEEKAQAAREAEARASRRGHATAPAAVCPVCGASLAEGSRFCGDCGTKLY